MWGFLADVLGKAFSFLAVFLAGYDKGKGELIRKERDDLAARLETENYFDNVSDPDIKRMLLSWSSQRVSPDQADTGGHNGDE